MKKELIGALAWAGGIIAVALAVKFAHQQGYVGGDTDKRVVFGIIGLWMAWYGNRIPKTLVRSAQARQAQRVTAWSQVLSGLTYAGLWVFAPISVAISLGCGAVVAGIVVTLGYCLLLRAKANTA